MDNQHLFELLRKYLTKEISSDELKTLEKWVNASEHNQHTLEHLQSVWETPSKTPKVSGMDPLIDKLWYEGVEKEQEKKINVDWAYFTKVAAIFLVTIASVFVVFTEFTQAPEENTQLTENLITKENPAGRKTKIHLPDGTVVWLNSDSKITYSQAYNQSSREVSLIGEAYFDVVEDPAKPFKVSSGDIKTIALGTSFNINAYPEMEAIQVSLLTGKVNVEMSDTQSRVFSLTPGHKLTYHKADKTETKQTFSPEEVLGWKDGILIFKQDSYENFVLKLERWFGVEVQTIGSPPEDWKLTTEYDNESLANILKNLRYGNTFNYELSNTHLTIKFK